MMINSIQKPFTINEDGGVPACPKCGNLLSFDVCYERDFGDSYHCWVRCECGFEPTGGNPEHYMEYILDSGSLDALCKKDGFFEDHAISGLMVWTELVNALPKKIALERLVKVKPGCVFIGAPKCVRVDPATYQHKTNEPHYCEIWCSQGEKHLVLGNSVDEAGEIWSLNRETDEMDYMVVTGAEKLESVAFETVLSEMEVRAEKGCADAMWWCAWAYEGKNHPRAVWYYIAALRANPQKHLWAWDRIFSDAHGDSDSMCNGVPEPCLEFLKEIPEFNNFELEVDWVVAIEMAKAAKHIEKKPEEQMTDDLETQKTSEATFDDDDIPW